MKPLIRIIELGMLAMSFYFIFQQEYLAAISFLLIMIVGILMDMREQNE